MMIIREMMRIMRVRLMWMKVMRNEDREVMMGMIMVMRNEDDEDNEVDVEAVMIDRKMMRKMR